TDRATQLLFDLAKNDKYSSDALDVLCDTLQIVGGAPRIVTWFETLNDSGKQIAMNPAARRIKDGDVTAAATWFASQADKPWRDDKHFHSFLNRYVDVNPMAAIAWAASLPPPAGSAWPTGLQSGVKRWALKDQVAPPKWLEAHNDQKW